MPAVVNAAGFALNTVAADPAAAAVLSIEDLVRVGWVLGAAAVGEWRATPAASASGGTLWGAAGRGGRYGGAERASRGGGALPEALAGTLDHIVGQPARRADEDCWGVGTVSFAGT